MQKKRQRKPASNATLLRRIKALEARIELLEARPIIYWQPSPPAVPQPQPINPWPQPYPTTTWIGPTFAFNGN